MKTNDSVHAVLAQLEIRRSMPMETRSLAVMDDKDGKTFLGLMVWNIGTLVQDTPELIAAFIIAIAVSIGLVAAKFIGYV
jgi:hypothetical protein